MQLREKDKNNPFSVKENPEKNVKIPN